MEQQMQTQTQLRTTQTNPTMLHCTMMTTKQKKYSVGSQSPAVMEKVHTLPTMNHALGTYIHQYTK